MFPLVHNAGRRAPAGWLCHACTSRLQPTRCNRQPPGRQNRSCSATAQGCRSSPPLPNKHSTQHLRGRRPGLPHQAPPRSTPPIQPPRRCGWRERCGLDFSSCAQPRSPRRHRTTGLISIFSLFEVPNQHSPADTPRNKLNQPQQTQPRPTTNP